MLLLRPRLHLVADALAHAQLRQPVLLEPEGEGQPLDHVQGLEQLQLLVEVQVRGVAGRVGQGAGMGDGADEGADPAIVAAELEDLLHHRPVLALELAGLARCGGLVRTLLDLHAQDAIRLGVRRAGQAPVQRHERGHCPSADGDALRHLRDHADLGVAAPVPGDDERAGVAADIGRERHRHAREDHDVVEWNQLQVGHTWNLRPILDDVNHPVLNYTVLDGAGDSSESGAWPLLVRLFFAQRANLPLLAAELQLSPAQCHVLHLIEPERPIPMGQLAETLACDASNVTGLVDRLESRGLVRRRPSAADRRVKVLFLTPTGARLRPPPRSHDGPAGRPRTPLSPRAARAGADPHASLQ